MYKKDSVKDKVCVCVCASNVYISQYMTFAFTLQLSVLFGILNTEALDANQHVTQLPGLLPVSSYSQITIPLNAYYRHYSFYHVLYRTVLVFMIPRVVCIMPLNKML